MKKIISIPKSLWNIVDKNPELKKILANMNWLFLDRIIQMAVAFFVGVWVIRYLGPEQYGILSYAVAFTALFGVPLKLGLESILIREFVNGKIDKDRLLGTAFSIKLIGSFLAIILSMAAFFFLRGDDMSVVLIALIISLGFIFQSLEVIDYWFQSHVASKFVAYSRSLASIFSGVVKIGLILSGASLVFFAVVILLESILISIGLIFSYKENKQNLKLWKFDFFVAKKLLNDSWPLALSAVSVMIYMKIDQVMIGSMLNDEALGNYSAAVALSEMWYFIPVIITGSVFPAILYARKKNKELYFKRLQLLYSILAWIAISSAAACSFFSEEIIFILYGSKYAASSVVFSVYMWSGVFVFLGFASGRFLIAENLNKIVFLRGISGAIVNVFLNIYMIPKYGIIGAAWATLISYLISTFIIIVPIKSRTDAFMLVKAFNLVFLLKLMKIFFINMRSSSVKEKF